MLLWFAKTLSRPFHLLWGPQGSQKCFGLAQAGVCDSRIFFPSEVLSTHNLTVTEQAWTDSGEGGRLPGKGLVDSERDSQRREMQSSM